MHQLDGTIGYSPILNRVLDVRITALQSVKPINRGSKWQAHGKLCGGERIRTASLPRARRALSQLELHPQIKYRQDYTGSCPSINQNEQQTYLPASIVERVKDDSLARFGSDEFTLKRGCERGRSGGSDWRQR